jgi:cell division control protein 24
MVETERKYVQDLEVMQVRTHIFVSLFFTDLSQKYATALSQSNTIDQDTIHLLFPGLNKLLNFQRKFLIRLESTAELPWKDQRWGLHFLENVSPTVPFFGTLCNIWCPFGTIGRRIRGL